MAGTRPCSKCAKRRQKIEALRAKRKAQGKPVQAAALGAVLAVSEAVGQTLGIHGEVEDEQDSRGMQERGDG
jgi:hypothetical protein